MPVGLPPAGLTGVKRIADSVPEGTKKKQTGEYNDRIILMAGSDSCSIPNKGVTAPVLAIEWGSAGGMRKPR